jgi:hypothetical protein
MRTYDNGYLQIILLLVFIGIVVLFLLTQQNTLKAVRRENRLMQPGLVWLQLIPVVGQIWQFIVVLRIAKSIRKEIKFVQGDSLFGSSDLSVAEKLTHRATLAIGITYCTLTLVGASFNLFMTAGQESPLTPIVGLIFLTGIACWIVYWVRLAQSRKILVRAASEADAKARI